MVNWTNVMVYTTIGVLGALFWTYIIIWFVSI